MSNKDFTDIFLALQDQLYRVAFYILESDSDASDAVQDLYLKLWQRRDVLDGIANPKAYCASMLKNICIDRMRKIRESSSDSLALDATDGTDVGVQLENREKIHIAIKAMECLSQTQRDVLRMKVLEDMTYEQMSQRTGMNNLTLRVLLSQARSKLKKYYEKN